MPSLSSILISLSQTLALSRNYISLSPSKRRRPIPKTLTTLPPQNRGFLLFYRFVHVQTRSLKKKSWGFCFYFLQEQKYNFGREIVVIMYRDRVGGGGGSSRSEIVGGPLDRKRIINDALDKHLEKSSPSTSRVGGLNSSSKDKESLSVPSTSTGKSQQQLDHRDSRSASLSKNKCSDGLSFSIFFLFNYV